MLATWTPETENKSPVSVWFEERSFLNTSARPGDLARSSAARHSFHVNVGGNKNSEIMVSIKIKEPTLLAR
jgi:hypothetical protein